MGGLATLIVFTIGAFLSEMDLSYVFYLGGGGAVIAMLILYRFIKEPRDPIDWASIPGSGQTKDSIIDKDTTKTSTLQNLREVFRNPNRSGLYVFFAVFFWFFAYNLIETFGSRFFYESRGYSTGTTTLILSAFLLTFILFAIPAGKIAERIGRRNTILVGILILLVTFTILAFIVHTASQTFIVVLFLIGGIGWSMININSIAIVWSLTSAEKIGAYTGVYYFFSFLAQIVGPVLGGLIFVLTDLKLAMFPLALGFFVIAGICMSRVKAGEVVTETAEERAKKEAFMRSHATSD